MMPICLVSLRVKCSIMYMYVYVTHSNKVSSHKKPYGRDILETYSYKLALGLLLLHYSTFFSQSNGNRFALRLPANYVECKRTYTL